jgi:hypothetical protein
MRLLRTFIILFLSGIYATFCSSAIHLASAKSGNARGRQPKAEKHDQGRQSANITASHMLNPVLIPTGTYGTGGAIQASL